MWHVSYRSGVATLRTAIHLLLVQFIYLLFSLHSNSAVDVDVKSRLVKDVLNLAGFMLPNKEDIMIGPQPPTDWRYEPIRCEICRSMCQIRIYSSPYLEKTRTPG